MIVIWTIWDVARGESLIQLVGTGDLQILGVAANWSYSQSSHLRRQMLSKQRRERHRFEPSAQLFCKDLGIGNEGKEARIDEVHFPLISWSKD